MRSEKEFQRKERKRILRQDRDLEEPSRSISREEAPSDDLYVGLVALRHGQPEALSETAVRALQCYLSNSALQRAAQEDSSAASLRVEHTLERERGNGQMMVASVREQMGDAFGSSFDDVRVHTGRTAADLSGSLGARAFAYGNDLYFAAGEYEPETVSGQRLLAHELAHVVQQTRGTKLIVGSVDDPSEKQADRAANEVVGAIRASGQNAQRQAEEEEEEEMIQPLHRQVESEEEEEALI